MRPLGQTKPRAQPLLRMSDDELMLLRGSLDAEMRRRGLAFSVGEIGERLAIEYFGQNWTSKLQPAQCVGPGYVSLH